MIPSLLAAGDPLFEDGVDGTVLLIVALKCLVGFLVYLTAVANMIWFERKLISFMQNRIGPNRAGPIGLLQTVADGIKLFTKEPLLPARADRAVFNLAPWLTAVPAVVAFSIIPFSVKPVEILGKQTRLQIADPSWGILLLLVCSSIAVYGVMLAGWASGSKYPLLGSVRASAQMVSYEAALGLAIVAVVLFSGSLLTSEIVISQAAEGPLGYLPNWNILRLGFVPFFIFVVAATAELNRPPFDLVEAEQELVGGYMTEYSAGGFMLFYFAEFGNTVTMSAIIVTLFLGGPAGPVLIGPAWLWGLIWFFVKLLVFLFMYVWLRATLPRFRYDQLMDLGWKKLIPTSLVWLLALAALKSTEGKDTAEQVVVVASVVGASLLTYALLARAVRVGRGRSTEESAPVEPARQLSGTT
ncbi:MAG: NADH-ubiquinone oxidoreductase chain H [uncultured Acidimicrobiales bacterium]|uniref:NADH-quinone oxidoreductase subunit H n=1 Tax=uncultured Acidimicrobiales bacterium TaxID=310071 RepID=A0A6J4IV16_9ACTN|nr:MAG: NADH-ubiquinone oxidoreductase chain H [uncultured Acidimicrobiales bacterium]